MARTKDAVAIPETMLAAAIDRFGPPSVIKVREMPVPDVSPNEVLIEIHAAGVGVWDESVRDGSWKPYGRTKFPLVLGTDGAGKVVATGARVRRFRIGDRVWSYHYANPKGGFYAEYVAVSAANVGRVPQKLDLTQAGAGATTGLTALQGIDKVLRVRDEETVLIFGATGGVGTLAIQFAKRKGARVIATATGGDAVSLVRKLGADETIDARSDSAPEDLHSLAPDGLNAALVLASGKTLEPCLDLVIKGGRIGYPNGVEPEPRKRRGVRVESYDAEASPVAFDRLEAAAEAAQLVVPIAALFPLEQADKAHERLERGHILGRIALQVHGRQKS
jgi:NADPH:quinone reductase-like Zn-dependent oxidoreductase